MHWSHSQRTLRFWFCILCGVAAAWAQAVEPGIHDPVMTRQDGTYYAFGTGRGITVLSSKDMKTWQTEPSVFAEAPAWVSTLIPDFRNSEWAPDVYFHNGTYHLYYAVSAFGRNNSAIGVVTNTTLDKNDPDYKWVDHGMVVKSVPGRDMWNAIDPQVFLDQDGKAWMTFGSFWGGIKLVRLNDNLLELASGPDREWHTIAARNRYWKLDDRDAGDGANPELRYDEIYPKEVQALEQQTQNGAIEAPFIFHKNDYYYLFASWDRCCRGVNSSYKIVVGRSTKVTGPYVDKEDERMIWGGGSLVVRGVSESKRWAALGHNAAYTFDGVDYLVFHAYDKTDRGRSKLVIKPIEWDAEGWPTVALNE